MATLFALGILGMLMFFAAFCVGITSVVATHRQAQSTADLAALAGAGAVGFQDQPCESADRIARRNHARLVSCQVRGPTVGVEVERRTTELFGQTWHLHAKARAGPGGLGGQLPTQVWSPRS